MNQKRLCHRNKAALASSNVICQPGADEDLGKRGPVYLGPSIAIDQLRKSCMMI